MTLDEPFSQVVELAPDAMCDGCGAVPDVFVCMPIVHGWCTLAFCAPCWQTAPTVTVVLSEDQSAEEQRAIVLAAIRKQRAGGES